MFVCVTVSRSLKLTSAISVVQDVFRGSTRCVAVITVFNVGQITVAPLPAPMSGTSTQSTFVASVAFDAANYSRNVTSREITALFKLSSQILYPFWVTE
jgi:hypothetical protein